MDQKPPKKYCPPIFPSFLAGFCIALGFAYISAFMGSGGRRESALETMIFLLTFLVVVCAGIILARIDRTRDEILDRLEALEQREPEQSPPPQPVPPEAPDSPATSPSEK